MHASKVREAGVARSRAQQPTRLRNESERSADGPSRAARPGPTVPGASKAAKAVITAMQTYGTILVDNGSPFFFQGEVNAKWMQTPRTSNRSSKSRRAPSKSAKSLRSSRKRSVRAAVSVMVAQQSPGGVAFGGVG